MSEGIFTDMELDALRGNKASTSQVIDDEALLFAEMEDHRKARDFTLTVTIFVMCGIALGFLALIEFTFGFKF